MTEHVTRPTFEKSNCAFLSKMLKRPKAKQKQNKSSKKLNDTKYENKICINVYHIMIPTIGLLLFTDVTDMCKNKNFIMNMMFLPC